jgi:hypothetical protein
MIEHEIPNMEKLNDENYANWSIKMKALLMEEECWDIIESEEPQEKNKKKEWIKKNSHALFRIVWHVEDNQLIHIKGCDSSRKAWEALKNQHEKLTLGKKVRLFKKLFHTKLQKKEDMETHVYQIFEWIDELKDLGYAMENEFKTALFMETLGDYEQLGSNEFKAWNDEQKFSKAENIPKYTKTSSSIQSHYSSYKCFNCNELGHISKDCDRKDLFLVRS